MKIRSSFVSNSSSSSYIIGIGLIKKEFEKEVENFVKNFSYLFEIRDGNNEIITVNSFNYDSVDKYASIGEKALVFHDAIDAETNEDGEIISDPEIEDFHEKIVSIMNNEDWFNSIDFKIGSGYNG